MKNLVILTILLGSIFLPKYLSAQSEPAKFQKIQTVSGDKEKEDANNTVFAIVVIAVMACSYWVFKAVRAGGFNK